MIDRPTTSSVPARHQTTSSNCSLPVPFSTLIVCVSPNAAQRTNGGRWRASSAASAVTAAGLARHTWGPRGASQYLIYVSALGRLQIGTDHIMRNVQVVLLVPGNRVGGRHVFANKRGPHLSALFDLEIVARRLAANDTKWSQ